MLALCLRMLHLCLPGRSLSECAEFPMLAPNVFFAPEQLLHPSALTGGRATHRTRDAYRQGK